MSETQVQISAQVRTDFGKGAARRLRREGRVPAVIYGRGSSVRHVSLPTREVTRALRLPRVVLLVDLGSEKLSVAPRDIQRDVVRQVLEHLDLVVIGSAEVAERAAQAEALAAAEAAAEEAGVDVAAAVALVAEAIAHGEDATAAAEHAVADVEQATEEAAAANAAVAAAEAAEAAE
jgi:large subunit ribosomal protein L25